MNRAEFERLRGELRAVDDRARALADGPPGDAAALAAAVRQLVACVADLVEEVHAGR